MSEKLIIENRSKAKMTDVLRLCEKVVREGRVSKTAKGRQYCFSNVWEHDGFLRSMGCKGVGKIVVSAFLNDKSDRLVVHHNDGKDYRK